MSQVIIFMAIVMSGVVATQVSTMLLKTENGVYGFIEMVTIMLRIGLILALFTMFLPCVLIVFNKLNMLFL